VTLVLVDTSTWMRRGQAAVQDALSEAIEAESVVLVAPVLLELLRSARDRNEHRELAEEYEYLHFVEITAEVRRRAVDVQGALSAHGFHRGPSPTDLLAAAAAEAVGAEIWHCDRHFELIAEVTGQVVKRVGR
jgi:predicted nucleic acid-binding protein